ncbi:auxin-responsive protein IAA6-like isoform X3 [Canna indica]|uniref:Auxin-responsive protein n=1 Tax=Canna indica TaxID=4628 RepID=A0AAQ3KLC8_9LILI|nr:auxin-responsive protein IAA6-like isoform X3 [Canna indica]
MEDLTSREDACPQLLDLIPNERYWLMVQDAGGGRGSRGIGRLDASEEKKLELRLGLPGEVEEERKPSVLSLGFFSKTPKTTSINPCHGAKRGVFEEVESNSEGSQQQQEEGGFFQLQSRAVSEKKWSLKTYQQQSLEREEAHVAPGNPTGPSTNSQTRTTSLPVVGWPPIRSFRKNLASSSVKQSVEHENGNIEAKAKAENNNKGWLVKINMDGIPIGRKVDLKACDSYEKLSLAVQDLFLGLLEAQKDTCASAPRKDEEAKQAFTGLLDGSGEYTLVYEDNEGDRMLVGDVPWEMFLSTVKRLRVLKSSDLSALRLGAVCRKRAATDC